MWIIPVNLFLAVVPALLLLLYFYRRDRNKREPPKLVWKAFLFGLIAVVPALLLELLGGLFTRNAAGLAAAALDAFIVTAVVEEMLKFLMIRWIIWKRKEFDEVMDGIVYTIAVSLGFAMLENIMYSFGSTLLVIIRGVTAVPLHAVSAGIMGYFLGLSKIHGRKTAAKGVIMAIIIHGLYDFVLFTESAAALIVVPLLIFCGLYLRRLIKKAIKLDLEHRQDWDIRQGPETASP